MRIIFRNLILCYATFFYYYRKNHKIMTFEPKIAIDARMIARSGIGTCIQHWIKYLNYKVILGDLKELENYKEYNLIQIPFVSPIYGYKEQLKFPYRLLKQQKPDILHIPHCNIPIFYRGLMLVTIHDLTHLVYPEFLPIKLAHLYFKFMFWFVSKRADHILVVSENTKRDMEHFFKVPTSKMTVVPLGVGEEFYVKSKSSFSYLYEKYDIPEKCKILLYVGNQLPHKNLERLLEGFSLMKGKENCRLVLVGKTFDGRSKKTNEKKLGIGNLVIQVGRVSQEELVDFYNLADLFVLPSLYEGFGLPILEAFACGTPVACSNTSSLPEVGGNVAKYFDPKDALSISKTLESAINDKGKYDEKIKAWVSQFTWKENAKKIQNVVKKMIENE